MAPTSPRTSHPKAARYIGSRAEPDVVRLIDVAAALIGENRSDFILQACMDRARVTLQEHSPGMLEEHFASAGTGSDLSNAKPESAAR